MSKEKVKIISDVMRMLLLSFLNGIDRFLIQRIPVPEVKMGVTMLLQPVRKMVDALNDLEPDNDAQVREVWRKFANADLADYSETTLLKLISEIKNDNIRPALSTLTVPTVNMLRIVTDEDPNNEQQLAQMWTAFLKSPDTHDVVLDHLLAPMLLATLKNPELVEYILQTIADILKGQGEHEKAAKVTMMIVELQNAA
jgi:hypothetical protein